MNSSVESGAGVIRCGSWGRVHRWLPSRQPPAASGVALLAGMESLEEDKDIAIVVTVRKGEGRPIGLRQPRDGTEDGDACVRIQRVEERLL
jgi:hypothetical protein